MAQAEKLAQVYASAFADTRPWSADEIRDLLNNPDVFICEDDAGFAMGRVVLDEAELLTICVLPTARGQGKGARLLRRFEEASAKRGATRAFLEVAQNNAAARRLYASNSWSEIGRRKHYYTALDGSRCDAIVLQKPLPPLQPTD
ncbi:GNAT family N-acetyltransferase [Aliiroseovarius marinus]|uniref:GNAT family N-acetyltransferase n=1 Tax=Aliiroseovarius marinus TaxID=2500159 RepID=UPI003D7E7113